MTTPLLRAIEEGGRSIDDPTADELHDMLADMNLSHRFVIYERLDRQPVDEHYMQVYLHDDFSYLVEYRDGSEDRHFEAHIPATPPVVGPLPVVNLMLAWAQDSDGWREAVRWTRKRF